MTTPLGMQVASTLTTMTATAARRQMWEDKLYRESLHDDIFFSSQLTETVDISKSDKPTIPNAFWLNIKGDSGNRSITAAFKRSLAGAAVEGNATALIGSEETYRMKTATFYANDYFKAVATLKFGIDYRELEPYQLWKEVQPDLSRWLAEYRGYMLRQAYLQTISHNLTAAPLSQTQKWNPNIFVANVNPDNQPAYDPTLASYTEAIGDALFLATGQVAATAASAILNVKMLNILQWYASDHKRIEPIQIGGQETYLVVLPSIQVTAFKDPTRTNSGMELFTKMAALRTPEDEKFFPNSFRWDKLLCVSDQRYPTVGLGGSNGTWTLTAGYEAMGRVDGRNTATDPSVFTVGTLCGKGSMAAWEPEKPHFVTQPDNYTKNNGEAIAGAFGYLIPKWDVDTGSTSASTLQQETSIALLMATPSFA
jgi:hypothetical protein